MIRRPRLGARLLLCLVASAASSSAIVARGQTPPKEKPVVATTDPGRGGIPRDAMIKPWTGDFDGMVKRRTIRILTPYSKTHYFIDRGVQRGIVYDSGMKLEEDVNKLLKTTPATKIHVVFVPTSRDALYQSLVEGRGDIISANVAVTPEREKLVDFTVPGRTNVNQIVVTGPGAPTINTLDDLSGKQVAVRDKGLQFDYLTELNARFTKEGKAGIVIKALPAALEDEDILEMVNSGPRQDYRRGRHDRRVLEDDSSRPQSPVASGRAQWRRSGLGGPQEQPEAPRHAEPARHREQTRHALRQRTVAEISEEHEVREERNLGSGDQEVPGACRFVQEIRRQVRPRLRPDDCAGVPGVTAQSGRQEPGRCGRRHAGHAGHRKGAEGRRHQGGRRERARRRQVHPLHDRPVFRQRADGPVEQRALCLRRLQLRSRHACVSCERKRRHGA